MTEPGRGWTRCRGCSRLRSTTDDDGVCEGCRALVAKGMIRLRPTVKVPERNADGSCELCSDMSEAVCVCGRDDLSDATRVKLAEGGHVAGPQPMLVDELPAPDPKQKPVKRRWWKRNR